MQESSGASEVFRQVPVPAMEVLWRPGPRVQEVKERLRVSGGTKWIGGSREKSVRVKEKLRVNMFQFRPSAGRTPIRGHTPVSVRSAACLSPDAGFWLRRGPEGQPHWGPPCCFPEGKAWWYSRTSVAEPFRKHL